MHLEKTIWFIQLEIPLTCACHILPPPMPLMGSYCTCKDSDLRTPHDFFNAAYEAGYRIVVASFRENQLARDVSSYKNDWQFINVRLGQVTSNYIAPMC